MKSNKKITLRSSQAIEFKRGKDQGKRKTRSDRGRKRSKRTFIGQSVRDGAKWGAGFGALVLAHKAYKNAPGTAGFIKNAPKAGISRKKAAAAVGLLAGRNTGKILTREAATTAGVFGSIAAAQMALSPPAQRRMLNESARQADQERLDRKRRR